MAEPGVERRLAAILAADVVGYSRLMAADEEGTLARLRALRAAIIDPKIAKHRGRIVKLMGDGALVEFASVVDAVRCAVDIQRGMSERGPDLPDDQRIRFCIGVNLGDVIIEGDDIYGDGVNVAARLEGLAEPGGIVISGTAFDHAKKAEAGFQYIGRQPVKNIPAPVRAYRVLLDPAAAGTVVDDEVPAAPARRRWPALAATLAVIVVVAGALAWLRPWEAPDQDPALPLPDKPSIAVLPFDNLSGDAEQDYFVDGLSEDIITALARFRDLFVIARHSSFQYGGGAVDVRKVGRELGVRYLLEGSVQKSGDRLRVTAQLVDAATGQHVWAERYDRPLVDLFEVQDEITQRIASTLGTTYGGAVQRAELARGDAGAAERFRAYDYFLRGIDHVDRFTKEDNAIAQEYFRKAIKLDPHFAKAYAKLAISHALDYLLGFAEAEEALVVAARYAEAALEADAAEPWAYWALAYTRLYKDGQHEQSLELYEKALTLNPNDADVLAEYGWTLAFAGHAEDGVDRVREAMRLNPQYPEWYLNDLSLGYLVLRDHKQVAATVEQMTSPGRSDRLYLASAYARLGRLEDARAQVEKVLQDDPDLTVEEYVATRRFKRPDDREYFSESLEMAWPVRPINRRTNGWPRRTTSERCSEQCLGERVIVAARSSLRSIAGWLLS